MENKLSIIWGGYVWDFLTKILSSGYSVEQISARNLEKNTGSLVGAVRWKLHRIFDDRETIQGNIRRLKQWERIIYGWRAGKLLDQLVDSIHKECPEQAGNFYIFGVNGFQDYGDDIPRLVLNHAIKEEQLQWEPPTPFMHSGKSCLYHPHPTDFDRELVENVGFDIKLTSDRNVFLKALYLKSCVNTVFNSIGIAEGYRYRNSAQIGSSLKYFEEYHGPEFLEQCGSELFLVLKRLAPWLIGQEEIKSKLAYVPDSIDQVVPSSVWQFYDYQPNNKPLVADYNSTDVHLLLGWVLKYAQTKKIPLPTLYRIHREIVYNGNRLNGITLEDTNPDSGLFFGPSGWYDTGIRRPENVEPMFHSK